MSESWRTVWRAVAPCISTAGLLALERALADDDARLLQGGTTSPPPFQGVQNFPVEGACVFGFCGWQGDGLATVSEVSEFFARLCVEVDDALGERAGCRHFLNWYDDTPRPQMIRELLPEVTRELTLRQVEALPCGSPNAP
jgi:hypothetical protein